MQLNDETKLNGEFTEADSEREEAFCVEEQTTVTAEREQLDDAQQQTAADGQESADERQSPSEQASFDDMAQSSRNIADARDKKSRALDIALWILVAVLAVVVILRFFVFGRITIVGDSMTSPYYRDGPLASLTFYEDDIVYVNKTATPDRGDVVVFYKNSVNKFKAIFASSDDETYKKLIKRIVALGGDKLWLEPCGDKYRLIIQTTEGDVLTEDYYVKNSTKLNADAFLLFTRLGRLTGATEDNPYVVKEGCFFAMGDNRDNSDDSRSDLGDVPYSNIYGVVM